MSTDEKTPIERAAQAVYELTFAGNYTDDDVHREVHEGIARAALSAAADVEEVARELFAVDSWQDRDFVLEIWDQAPEDSQVKTHWRRIANAVAAWLTGGAS